MRTFRLIFSLTLVLAALTACGSTARESRPRERRLPYVSSEHAERVVEGELLSLLGRSEIRSARVVVLSSERGEILAANARDRSGPHPSLVTDEIRSHGSTAKLFTLTSALEAGVVQLGDRFEGGTIERDGATIADHEVHGAMSLEDIVAYSSNVGSTRVFDRLGGERLFATLDRFHLAERVPASLRAHPEDAARFAYGGLEASALEVASAYLVIARGGTWPGGERIVSPETSATMLSLLEAAVQRTDGTGHPASIEGLRVAGKTGTVPFEGGVFGVFVGIVPVEAPTHVILVAVEAEGENHSGSTLAAPAFTRIARQLVHDTTL
ncbi:MAG: serine hydrolase [Sandaracinaceae bacterium]|nr:serine hydrolase [Sandaracinaceae bacterium]